MFPDFNRTNLEVEKGHALCPECVSTAFQLIRPQRIFFEVFDGSRMRTSQWAGAVPGLKIVTCKMLHLPDIVHMFKDWQPHHDTSMFFFKVYLSYSQQSANPYIYIYIMLLCWYDICIYRQHLYIYIYTLTVGIHNLLNLHPIVIKLWRSLPLCE